MSRFWPRNQTVRDNWPAQIMAFPAHSRPGEVIIGDGRNVSSPDGAGSRSGHKRVLRTVGLLELTEEFPESPAFAAEYGKVMHRPVPAQIRPD